MLFLTTLVFVLFMIQFVDVIVPFWAHYFFKITGLSQVALFKELQQLFNPLRIYTNIETSGSTDILIQFIVNIILLQLLQQFWRNLYLLFSAWHA